MAYLVWIGIVNLVFTVSQTQGATRELHKGCCIKGQNKAKDFNGNFEVCQKHDLDQRHFFNLMDKLVCRIVERRCCLKKLQELSCQRGKSEAYHGKSCRLAHNYRSGDRFEKCCDCCTLGLTAAKQNLACDDIKIGEDKICRDVYQDCCISASSCTPGWCHNGGSCSIVNGSTHCSCPSSFTGKQCEVDVDECSTLSQPCQNGGTCINTVGGYYCRCITGWEGADCSINIDDCKNQDGYPACQHGGTCVDRVGGYKCVCPPGKTGLMCQFDDKCASNPCSGNATCVSSPFGEAICICPHGWTGPNNYCDIDVQDCNVGNNPCFHGGLCRDLRGSFVCDCVPGFTGSKCEININECASSPCKNGICLDYYNKFECACNEGWTGKLCDYELNECESKPCYNGGQCHDKMANYSCTCPFGYSGRNCEIDINECSSSPCKNGGTCQDLVGKYTCSCPVGFSGANCEFHHLIKLPW